MRKIIRNIKPEDETSNLFKEFFDSEKAGGLILIFCTVLSIILANSGFRDTYTNFWNYELGSHTIQHWINDGLMAIFFLLIGLELEREIYVGELSTLKKTLLPVSSAIGGMLIPALVYLLFNSGTSLQSGFGIPMATDIAFAVGILSMIKNVPISLKVFLTGLAIVDDIGAITIIAIFYSKAIIPVNLIISLLLFMVLLILNRARVNNLIPYVLGGIGMWYFMSLSGVHATISGVLLAFAIPFRKGDKESPSDRLQHWLHKPVAFFILPLFALANTAIVISPGVAGLFSQNYAVGILGGLVIGKPVGILLFGFLAVKMKICSLPDRIHWKHITGIGFIAGIGFTMSVFITILAFDDLTVINNSKIAILLGSLISGLAGYLILKWSLRNAKSNQN